MARGVNLGQFGAVARAFVLFFWLVFTSFVCTFVMNVSKVLVGHLVVSESVRNNYYDFSGRLAT